MRFQELSLEDVRALYFDDSALQEPPYKLYRATGGDARWYYEPASDRYFPSVTTVIHSTTPMPYGLQQYLMNHPDPEGYRDERAAYGTWLHIACGRYLIDGEYDLDEMAGSLEVAAFDAGLNPANLNWYDNAKKDLLAWAAFCLDHSVEPLAVETVLKTEDGYAGAVDLVCNMRIGSGSTGNFIKKDQETGGIPITAIIDIKSGNLYPDHAIQLHMYKRMVAENFSVEVDRLLNWTARDWRSSPSYQLKDQTDSDLADLIPHLVGQFNARNKSGPSRSLVVSGKLTPDTVESCYKYQDLRDRFKESFSGDGASMEVVA